MALIKSVKGLTPKWGKECYFSENAAIVGEVVMGDECSIWFNAVVRGDVAHVHMGNRVNVQDGACVHVTNGIGPTEIEDDVSIGHNATVHACTIRRGALIGMGATVLDNADIGEGAIVAAGALVLQGTKIGPHEIWAACLPSSSRRRHLDRQRVSPNTMWSIPNGIYNLIHPTFLRMIFGCVTQVCGLHCR